jgi:transposase
MIYLGVDYNIARSHITAMGEGGELIWRGYVANNKDSVNEMLRKYCNSNGSTYAVVEATNCWNVIYEILEETGVDVKLAHTLKLKAIAEAQIKTDKIDSDILAHLLRCNLIPSCYVPSSTTREIKHIIRQRFYLVKVRTGIKNKIHQIITRNNIKVPNITDLFGKAGRKFLQDVGRRKENIKKNTFPGLHLGRIDHQRVLCQQDD